MTKDRSLIRSVRLLYIESPHLMKWSLRGETHPLTHSLSKELLSGQLLIRPLPPPPYPIPHSILPVPPSKPHFSLSPPFLCLNPTTVQVSNWCWPPPELKPRAKDLISHLLFPPFLSLSLLPPGRHLPSPSDDTHLCPTLRIPITLPRMQCIPLPDGVLWARVFHVYFHSSSRGLL